MFSAISPIHNANKSNQSTKTANQSTKTDELTPSQPTNQTNTNTNTNIQHTSRPGPSPTYQPTSTT